jgi:hypothetical protein
LEPATLGSELVNVTNQDTAVLVLTRNVLLAVVTVPVFEVPFSAVEYACPLTGEPLQSPLVKSWADSVPFNGAPLADETVPVSLGSQFWLEALAVESVTVKHSPVLASLDPV